MSFLLGRWWIGALAVALFASNPAWSQSGGLEVRVFDTDGTLLPGATVTLTNDARLVAPTTLITDRQGLADFPVLRVGGGYVVEVNFPGLARQRISTIRVSSGEPLRLPVRLTAEIVETVEVSAERPVVDLDDSSSASRFTDEFIQDLPVQGRFYQNVLTLAPGVLDADGDGNPNVHGGRSRDFKATVSGVSNVDPLTGEWLSYVNPESIEELKVIPAGAGAEFGRAQGGFAQIVQKQGTNDFEGLFTFLYSSSSVDGNGATDIPEDQIADFQWLQPGFQISGPIVKDRLWFRLSHEWISREDPVNTLRKVELVTREQTIAADQLTWQVSPRNKLAFQFQYDPKVLTNVGVSARVPAEATQQQEFGGPTYSLTWTAAQSPRLLVDSVVAYQDANVNVLPSQPGVTNSCVVNPGLPALDFAQCYLIDRNLTSGSYPIASRDNRQRFTVTSAAEFEAGRWLGVSHRLKFGFASENERYYRTLEQGPDATLKLDPVVPGLADATYRLPFPETTSARAAGKNWSVWLEDRFRIGSNVALSLGVRVDQEGVDSLGWSPFDPDAEAAEYDRRLAAGDQPFRIGPQVFTAYEDIEQLKEYLSEVLEITDDSVLLNSIAEQSSRWINTRYPSDIRLRNTNVAPRFSVSWDPWSDGKTKLFATAGRYYDKIFLAVPLIELEPATITYPFNAVAFQPGRFTTTGYPTRPGSVSTRIVSRDLSTPYQDEVTAGIEREISAETSVKFLWIERRFEDQLQDVDINHAAADYGSCSFGAPWVYTGAGPDGILDDCWEGSDGLVDLYTRNPAWDQVFLVGNFNQSRYRGFVLELVRRLYRSWQMDASYTWSKAIGDAEDFNQFLGNDRTIAADESGYLGYDQRHVVKVNGMVIFGKGIHLGGIIQWESGLPYSILVTGDVTDAVAPRRLGDPVDRLRFLYPTGQRNDQRNEGFWTWNVRLSKDWVVGRSASLSLSLEVFNLWNDDPLRVIDRTNGVDNSVRRFGRRYQLGTRIAF